ncbi:hypothetical protein ACFWBM_39035 [Streptomyces sp. NPDC059980]|uniref:hypothetical protein n=1 Tax=Streptomyces sp. NPDC059980 TaxID=3347022 RepID=UPI0036C29778
MPRIRALIAAASLLLCGLLTSPSPAHASTQGDNCNAKWPGRNGSMHAWDWTDCTGSYLGGTTGNDLDWGDGAGAFTNASNRARSVMNAGFFGGRDVVAFYFLPGGNGSYGCLAPGELYADYLGDNTFTNGASMDRNIMASQWVTASACAGNSWIT